MKNEVSELISDIKEQILYLQELGVGDLAVDLPEISLMQQPESGRPKTQIAPERLEKFIPTDLLKSVAEQPKTSLAIGTIPAAG